jgi:hypothetical protein
MLARAPRISSACLSAVLRYNSLNLKIVLFLFQYLPHYLL